MRVLHRPLRAGGAAVLGLATIALTGAFAAGPASAATSAVTPHLAAVKDSLPATTDKITGAYTASSMSVEVALAPRDEAGLNAELQSVYTKGSSQYGKYLGAGQFDAQYAPAASTVAAITNYLHGEGLSVAKTDSPFLLQAKGSSAQIQHAFSTTLNNYVDPHGTRYFSNSKQVYLPSTLASSVQGVIGLSNTVREQSQAIRPEHTARKASKQSSASSSCESTYPTAQWLFDAYVSAEPLSYGYGGGPDCAGLTPQQTNSIYGAPNAGPRAKGQGVSTAVFELSAYQASDIAAWAKQFYGSGYHVNITNVTVDGGPLNPVCPSGDTCPAQYNGYSGDIEVDADIEQELAVAPDANLYVYNAPNDETGQTELDEYTKIAQQDKVDSISSSWGECENDAGEAYAQAENTVFEQMALQGQSVFSSAGDTGAFDCIRSDGTTVVNVDDPASQPWVTSVGGTSLETDNPKTSTHPGYPSGTETVWNDENLCSEQGAAADNDNQGGYFWCANTGAGGGGASQFWSEPFYQKGAIHDTTRAREVPDVSADADEFTPYAEYCTGSSATPESTCATINGGGGWFGIGGTSLSSPLWGALIADRDAYQGYRTGNINPLVYSLSRAGLAGWYLHDIAAPSASAKKAAAKEGVTLATNNGLFSTGYGYDQATGLGTPKFAAIITGF
jgi:subtilase family serine protease